MQLGLSNINLYNSVRSKFVFPCRTKYNSDISFICTPWLKCMVHSNILVLIGCHRCKYPEFMTSFSKLVLPLASKPLVLVTLNIGGWGNMSINAEHSLTWSLRIDTNSPKPILTVHFNQLKKKNLFCCVDI